MLSRKYFNSIKVRLEHYVLTARLLASLFQFHKGTIRTIHLPQATLILPDFNSIKVRLEQVQPYMASEKSTQFQFHKGTIRTYNAFLDRAKGKAISIP